MALWFVSYGTPPITVTIYDVSIVIVYDVTLLLSMTYHFQSRLGKTDCTDIWVRKLKNQVSPSIGFRVPHCAARALAARPLSVCIGPVLKILFHRRGCKKLF